MQYLKAIIPVVVGVLGIIRNNIDRHIKKILGNLSEIKEMTVIMNIYIFHYRLAEVEQRQGYSTPDS